jgi:hypothetical protein
MLADAAIRCAATRKLARALSRKPAGSKHWCRWTCASSRIVRDVLRSSLPSWIDKGIGWAGNAAFPDCSVPRQFRLRGLSAEGLIVRARECIFRSRGAGHYQGTKVMGDKRFRRSFRSILEALGGKGVTSPPQADAIGHSHQPELLTACSVPVDEPRWSCAYWPGSGCHPVPRGAEPSPVGRTESP